MVEFPANIATEIQEVDPGIKFPFQGKATPAEDPALAVQKKLEVKSIEVPLADVVKEAPESRTIDFKDSNFLGSHVAQPTSEEPAAAAAEPSEFAGKTTDELRAQMVNEELQPVDEMAPEDFEMIAGFLIDMWDVGTVTLFRLYALDSSDAPYEMTTGKKGKLKKLLTMILIRFNKKFPLGVLFFMTLILTSITPAMKAHQHRQLMLEERKKRKPKKAPAKKPSAKKRPAGGKAPAAAAAAVDLEDDGSGIGDPDELEQAPAPTRGRGKASK